MSLTTYLVVTLAALAAGQRPFFAGLHPIGYPEVTTEALGDRFGEIDGTTQRLPIEANGDRDLVDRLSKLPIDKQPFWFINWQALEAHRQNPQTYPQKPNPFVDQTSSSNSANPNPGNTNVNSGNISPSTGNSNPNTGNVSPNSGNGNSNFVNTVPNNGNVNTNSGSGNRVNANGNINPDNGNVNSNSGSVNPSGNVKPISGNANLGNDSNLNSGFVSSNRFGVEEHPNNQDSIENAFTNSDENYTKSDEKKQPQKNEKPQHYHY